MSLKYERVKKADLALPAPLRWLTRAFSSIPLAIVLLTLVALYGTIASVPLVFLVRALAVGILILLGAGLGGVVAYNISIGRWLAASFPTLASRLTLAIVILLAGVSFSAVAGYFAADYINTQPWYVANHATVIYRLPYFEMTEAEFYAWWPMRLFLGLFVINMVWATIRRIEFKFVNIGVLTVHVGIVTIAVGSIIYSANKMEGDTIVWRKDLGSRPVSEFYDSTRPALYFLNSQGHKVLQVDLEHLPRYNDHPREEHYLNLPVSDKPDFARNFGNSLTARIDGFIAYGELQQVWADAADTHDPMPPEEARNPAIELSTGDKEHADPDQSDHHFSKLLISGTPAERLIDQDTWALEFLFNPDPQRIRDLMEPFEGDHGLIVEIPAKNFRQVYPIAPGKVITAGDTGYTITVDSIGPYGMAFATKGYQGVSDTRALVTINDGTKTFRRIALYRYPERTQDFIPDPTHSSAMGPMGKRVDPDKAIRLAYIDASKPQFRIVAKSSDLKEVTLQVRLPGAPPFQGILPEGKFPLGSAKGKETWMHITRRLTHAVQKDVPSITPQSHRNPKDEGTFINSLVPVTFELPASELTHGQPWQETVWLAHMRYPDLQMASGVNRPQWVQVPGLGRVGVLFSRVARPLPFLLELDSFDMQPYPNSDIPRDYVSNLTITHLSPQGQPAGEPITAETRLNNPFLADGAVLSEIIAANKGSNPVPAFFTWLRYATLKLSQSGWDPGDRSDPQRLAKDAKGRFLHQQRYSILTVGNNVAIHAIFVGAILIVLGVPWAFYLKPWLVKRESQRLREQYAKKVVGGQ